MFAEDSRLAPPNTGGSGCREEDEVFVRQDGQQPGVPEAPVVRDVLQGLEVEPLACRMN